MLWSKSRRKENVVVRNARVLDPVAGVDAVLDVRVDCGVIAQLGSDLDTNEHRVVDGRGMILAPAFVDPHVHLRTPGREDEETVASGTQAAAAGGYCAILAMPNTDPVVDSAAVLGALVETACAQAEVPVGFLGAITKGQQGAELAELAELADAGAAGFTDDGRPVEAAGLLRRAFAYARPLGVPIALHEQDLSLTRRGQMHEGAVSAELGFAGWPSVAESSMVARDLRIAAYEDGRIHLQHLSCRASVEEVEWARDRGLRVSCEASPHHLLLTDEAVRTLDANAKMNPPLGSADDRAALIDGVRSGTIDCIATDHAPHAAEEKEVPFEAAPFGVTGLETAFPALLTGLVLPGLLSLETVVTRLTAGPAAAFGLPRPRLAIGMPATLSVWDLEDEWTVRPERFLSRSANSAFLGQRLRGACRLTLAEGRPAFHEADVEAVR